MKQTKAAGTKRELQVVHLMQDRGYVAFRTPASLGVCDVIAMTARVYTGNGREEPDGAAVLFIEVKANKGGPFMHFRKHDRKALKLAARAAGATPWLFHWPPNGTLRELPAEDWPGASLAVEEAA